MFNYPEIILENVCLSYSFLKPKRLKEEFRNFFSFSEQNEKVVIEALNDITLCINKGRTVGIIGRNGAGKSTLLKVIAGVYKPDSGRVLVNSKNVQLLSLGLGFDNNASGLENIYMSSFLRGYTKKEIEERIDAIVDFAELSEVIYNPIKTYSSGMRSRLAFSIAVHFEPDVLLIDEVLSVGDSHFQKKSHAKIKSLILEDSRTVVIVSHSAGTLCELCHEVVWLEKGRIVQVGSTKDVLEHYEKGKGKYQEESV
jgi:ABC-type polysaccharide/polyol phosphate transport system ATPase subunit